jgi:S-adenosylmethionine synthetase
MARQNYLFTSESVSEGHPDKVCDRISDEIVDLVYKEARKTGVDPWTVRVACETLTTTNRVVIAGEVRVPDTLLKKDKKGNTVINPSRFRSAARRAIRAIGYEQDGFHWKTCKIDVLLHSQSADIAQGVDNAADRQGEEGAGDQGIMFGYACRETPELMPAPIYYSHKILELMAEARHKGEGDAGKLGPDAKSQVTIRYENGKPAEVTSIVVSTQHLDGSGIPRKVRSVIEPYVRQALGDLPIASDCNWYINPTGKFVIGGPDGDAGLTGRKIIVDTYGGAAPHGGGAFSGKDTTKVDRSAAYAARYLAKNIVAAKLADRCTIQLVLRHRCSPAAVGLCRYPRHRQGARDGAGECHSQGHGPVALWHSPSSRPEQADLCQDRRLWSLWPQAGCGRCVLVGKDQPHHRPQGGCEGTGLNRS